MPDYSLIPVDYQPDFDSYSLIPVDYDPFAADGVIQHAQIQQAQPHGPPQQQPATGAGQPDAGAPAAGGGPSGSLGGGIGPTGGAPNPTLDQGAAKAAPFGGYSLVPVDYQPNFDGYSLIPVDYDPFAADGVTQHAQIQQPPAPTQPAQPQPQTQLQQPATGAGQPGVNGPATGNSLSGSGGGGIGPTGGAPNPTLEQGAAKAAPFGSYANPTPTDSRPSNGGLFPLRENGVVDSYAYGKYSTGTPPAGPQVTTANRNLTITATDNAKPTNAGGVYGHTLTFSEPGSNNLLTITAADPTGLLVATPAEGDPSNLSVREYKGY